MLSTYWLCLSIGNRCQIDRGTCMSRSYTYVIEIPPVEVSDFMGQLKSKSTLMIFGDMQIDASWGVDIWAKGYFVDTVGKMRK
ncbi:MAG: transposase [Longibaculum sp.]